MSIDPKSELSRLCLALTPPDCGKRVWFLDLGRPAFGMSPLRLIGDRITAIPLRRGAGADPVGHIGGERVARPGRAAARGG